MPSMPFGRNAPMPIFVLPLRKSLPKLLWERIRPIRIPELRLPIVFLGRAVRVIDSFPIWRVRIYFTSRPSTPTYKLLTHVAGSTYKQAHDKDG